MTIIYLTPGDKESAEAHAYPYNELVQSINEQLDEVNDITISSHTNIKVTGFGKLSPLTLAKKLSANYKGDKSKLEHLFLLTCAGGLSINNQPCLAKQLAQALFENGFTKIKVHAPIPPSDIQSEDMILKVYYNQAQRGGIRVTITHSLEIYRLNRAIDFLEEYPRLSKCISFFSTPFGYYLDKLRSYRSDSDLNRTTILSLPGNRVKEVLQDEFYTFTANSDPTPYKFPYNIARRYIGWDEDANSKCIEFLNRHVTCDFETLIGLLKEEIKASLSPDLDGYRYSLENITKYLIQEFNKSVPEFPEDVESILNDIERKRRLSFGFLESLSINQLIFNLQNYIKVRSNQSEYCSSFLLQGFTKITEWISKSLSYILNEYQSKTCKINTAQHVIAKLQRVSIEKFSSNELKALRNGKLGSIIKDAHPFIVDEIGCNCPPKG